MTYLQLFLSFLQIGISSFGGGYAALPLIEEQVVHLHAWLTIQEFTDLVTISQMSPGPIAINAATFVGIRVGGVLGAVIATFGSILPSCLIVSVLAYLYTNFGNISAIQEALTSLRPAVVALIASAGLSMIIAALWVNEVTWNTIKWDQLALMVGAILLLRWKKCNPILVMVLAGVVKLITSIYILS